MRRHPLHPVVSGVLALFVFGALMMTGCDEADTEEFALTLSDEFERIGKRNGHAYYVSDSSYTWTDAKERAAAVTDASEGHLVTFGSAAEEEFVGDAPEVPDNFWLGLTDRASEGDWRWTTGEPLDYTNWNDGEPNNVRGGEDVAAWQSSGWNDTVKDEEKQFVLELEK